MDTAAGGHISHGHPATLTGRDYRIIRYGVDRQSERIDLAEVEALARQHRPKLITVGGSAYPRIIDFAGFRRIADAVGARLMVDMAHFAGLVATELYPSPFPAADVVTTTTYKSLRGARGGTRAVERPRAVEADSSRRFPGRAGIGDAARRGRQGRLPRRGAAAGVPRATTAACSTMPQALAATLAEGGFRLVAGGTDTGLMLVDLRRKE